MNKDEMRQIIKEALASFRRLQRKSMTPREWREIEMYLDGCFNAKSEAVNYEKLLKPCPFCGGKAQTVVDDETEEKDGVKCFACGGCIDAIYDDLFDAIDAWNRRTFDGR